MNNLQWPQFGRPLLHCFQLPPRYPLPLDFARSHNGDLLERTHEAFLWAWKHSGDKRVCFFVASEAVLVEDVATDLPNLLDTSAISVFKATAWSLKGSNMVRGYQGALSCFFSTQPC